MDDDSIEIEGIPGWERRLSRRDKLRRTGIAALAIGIALALLLTFTGAWQSIAASLPFGTASAGNVPPSALLKPLSVTAHPPTSLAAGPWSQIALPIPGAAILSYAASPADPSTLYLCASSGVASAATGIPMPLRVWRTRDSGKHWQALALPPLFNVGCYLHIAEDAPTHLALLSTNAGSNQQSCAQVTIFLSDDGGDHWRQTRQAPPAPRSAGATYCDIAISAQHLYFLHAYETAHSDNNRTQTSQIERSDDGGKTWTRADNGLPQDTLFFPTVLHDGVTIITSVLPTNAQSDATFWFSRDAGADWVNVDTLPDSNIDAVFGNVLVGAPGGAGSHPIYGESGEDIPDLLFREQVYQSVNGGRWSALPPLPIPGVTPEHMGIVETLGVAPSGSLYAFGVSPQDGLPAGDIQTLDAQWLWQWQPQTQRWTVAPYPLPRPSPQECGSRCWNAQFSSASTGTYLWVLSESASQALYRVRVSS